MINTLPEGATWVEIGCFYGRSLAWLMVELENRNHKINVYAVDTWLGNDAEIFYVSKKKMNPDYFSELYEKFTDNLKPFERKFEIYKMLSWDAANNFEDESVDYALIDAGHDYLSVSKDIAAWWPKIKKGGYLGGDDYGLNEGNDVFTAVHEFIKKHGLHLELFDSYKINGKLSKKAKNWLVRK